LLSRESICAITVVNVATEEFGFGAVVLIEKLVFKDWRSCVLFWYPWPHHCFAYNNSNDNNNNINELIIVAIILKKLWKKVNNKFLDKLKFIIYDLFLLNYNIIIIWQGSLEVNPNILIGCFLVGILPHGPFPRKQS